jgi:hypothetical protein
MGIQLPKPSPADWGVGMTCCIAAMCDEGKKIVTVSDHMLTMGDFSADGLALKNDLLHRNWFALWSDDASYVTAILDLVRKQLDRDKEHDWLEVATAFVNARNAILSFEINSQVLSRHNYSDRTFYGGGGRAALTPTVFNSLQREVCNVKLDVEFLVGGFDKEGDGHIFTFDNNGATKSCDQAGFWSIGSGSYSANSTIFFAAKRNGFNQNSDLRLCLYVASSAKFMAESADGVGIKTFVTVQEFNHPSGYVPEPVIDAYRTRWFENFAPKLPRSEADFLMDNLKPGKLMPLVSRKSKRVP